MPSAEYVRIELVPAGYHNKGTILCGISEYGVTVPEEAECLAGFFSSYRLNILVNAFFPLRAVCTKAWSFTYIFHLL